MQTLKFNSEQLSIFDFKKAQASRKELRQRINKTLNLDDSPSQKDMLEAILKKPELYSVQQRMFLRQCIWMEIDSKSLTEKQEDFLHGLYLKASPSSSKIHVASSL